MSKTRNKTRRKKSSPARLEVRVGLTAEELAGTYPLSRNVRSNHRMIVRLGEDEIGYCMDPRHSPERGKIRLDDCLRPAVATVLQVPVEQIPDPRIDARMAAGDDPEVIVLESWARLEAWLAGRGFGLVFHNTGDLVPDRERWIGVVGLGTAFDGLFNNHCIVMCRHQVLFDPAIGIPCPHGQRIRPWRLSDVTYGISCDPKEQ